MSTTMKTTVAYEAVKAAPPAAVTYALYVAGMSLDDWVKIGTLMYLAVQFGYLIWKWWREAQKRDRHRG